MEKDFDLASLLEERSSIPDFNVWMEKVGTLLGKTSDELQQQGRSSVLDELLKLRGEGEPSTGTDSSLAKDYLDWYHTRKNAQQTTKQAFEDDDGSAVVVKISAPKKESPMEKLPIASAEDTATTGAPNKLMTDAERKKAETAALVAEKQKKAEEKVTGKPKPGKEWKPPKGK